MSEKVAIIGSGLVGKSWAMIFASAGYRVSLYDVEPSQVKKALENIKDELVQFEKDGVLRGQLSAEAQSQLITGSANLSDCIEVKYLTIEFCIVDSLFPVRMLFMCKNVCLKSSI